MWTKPHSSCKRAAGKPACWRGATFEAEPCSQQTTEPRQTAEGTSQPVVAVLQCDLMSHQSSAKNKQLKGPAMTFYMNKHWDVYQKTSTNPPIFVCLASNHSLQHNENRKLSITNYATLWRDVTADILITWTYST